MAISKRPLRLFRLAAFAIGDFAFNLYWQSVMLFLLFYYTETLGIGMSTAALGYMLASVWDGIANFAAGVLADRRRATGGHGWFLRVGAVPLGLSFALVYAPMPLAGSWRIAAVVAAHLLFRTAYAFVNVPYLAMSARISSASGDRALIAGMRMLFGTAAAIIVALGTLPIGRWARGSGDAASPYFASAAIFALVATAIIAAIGWSHAEAESEADTGIPPSLGAGLASLAGNRAFVTLGLAMMAMIVGVTVLGKSVLYYFKYFLRDEAGGQLALASIGAVSLVALPLWLLLSRRVGTRAVWWIAGGLGIAALALFAAGDVRSAALMQLFLIVVQVAVIGLNFAFWAMLPDTIEYGEHATGLRVEGVVFGVAALIQRVAIGIATAVLGLGFVAAGYVANVEQSAATLAGMRWTIVLAPLLLLALSALLMAANPLAKGVHAGIVRELAGKRRGDWAP